MSAKARGVWFTVSLSLTVALVLAGSTTLYYYLQFSSVERTYKETLASLDKVSYQVNILINYGNGTRQWFNNTRIPIGWNLYNATVAVARLDAKYFPEFKSHFVNAIDGVGLVPRENWFWILWIWDPPTKDWKVSEAGADLIVLTQGQMAGWYYEDTSSWPPEKPS